MKKSVYITYATRELCKRPTAFLSGFLICFSGLLISITMLFFQYGSYLSQLQASESKYHLRLPELTVQEIEKIQKLPYVESIEGVQTGEYYTGYIHLKNNDPLLLKEQCAKILKDTGIDQTDAYKSNLYYQTYGVQETWLNQEYYDLRTQNFFSNVAFFILPLLLLTAIGTGLAVRLKVKTNLSEYAVMRSYGVKSNDMLRILRMQYTLLYFAASVLSFILGCACSKIFSFFLKSYFTENFLQIEFAVPLGETIFLYVFVYMLILLAIQLCGKLLKTDIVPILNGIHDYTISYVSHSSEKIATAKNINYYNYLYLKRTRYSFSMQILRKSILLILPTFFILQTIVVYGMREQAQLSQQDYSIYSKSPNYVTTEVVDKLLANDFVAEVTPILTYEPGRYSGVQIYCVEGQESAATDFMECIAAKYALQFIDNYHNKAMIIMQSNTFTAFYLFQSALLFISALFIILADERYALLRRTYEFTILRALGVSAAKMKKLYLPEMINALISLEISAIITTVVFALGFGIPYIKPFFIMLLMLILIIVYITAHTYLYNAHLKSILHGSISKKIGDFV